MNRETAPHYASAIHSQGSGRCRSALRWPEGLLVSLAFFGLLVRILVPPGFMLGGEGEGWIRLCPADPAGQFLQVAAPISEHSHGESHEGHEGHHGHHSMEASHSEHSNDSEGPSGSHQAPPCAMGLAFGSPALAETTDFNVQLQIVLLAEQPTSLATPQIATSSVQARGPPLFS